jgi:hypothetical protein
MDVHDVYPPKYGIMGFDPCPFKIENWCLTIKPLVKADFII